ncbi:MAG: hypothetical protein PHS41_02570 [Victivallaceae bacterium]|nr:hypothetical protein [Victivallaceae bacterium]
MRKHLGTIGLLGLLLAALAGMLPGLLRPLWFDEAVTFFNFMTLESPLEIYRNYTIPNNQVIYTVAAKYFSFVPWFGEPRSFALIVALGTLATAYCAYRKRFGSDATLAALLALGCSGAFLNYGTAIRGYMLSMFLLLGALLCAERMARSLNGKNLLFYAICAVLAVGTIPSNLLGLGAIVLWVLPMLGAKFYRKSVFWLLCILPFAALALFYLPMGGRAIGAILSLREGWSDRFGAIRVFYTVCAATFGVLLLPAAWGYVLRFRAKGGGGMLESAALGIFLLPVVPCLMLRVAPFPRVFFPMMIFFALVLARGVGHLTAAKCRRRRRWNRTVWSVALLVAVLGWGFVLRTDTVSEGLSARCGGERWDDYFRPYYLRREFSPRGTIEMAKKLSGDGRYLPLYATFNADPWSIAFAAFERDYEVRKVIFHGPTQKISAIAPGTLLVTAYDESVDQVAREFGIPPMRIRFVAGNGFHRIYFFE